MFPLIFSLEKVGGGGVQLGKSGADAKVWRCPASCLAPSPSPASNSESIINLLPKRSLKSPPTTKSQSSLSYPKLVFYSCICSHLRNSQLPYFLSDPLLRSASSTSSNSHQTYQAVALKRCHQPAEPAAVRLQGATAPAASRRSASTTGSAKLAPRKPPPQRISMLLLPQPSRRRLR